MNPLIIAGICLLGLTLWLLIGYIIVSKLESRRS